MKRTEILPAELLWEDDGHLTELVLSALADEEDAIVPSAAHAHLDGCERCLSRLGTATARALECEALLSALPALAAVSKGATDLAAPPSSLPEDSRRRAALRPPRFAISAALLLATLGTLPFFFDLPAFFSEVSFMLSRGAPILVRSLMHFFVSASGSLDRVAMILPGAAALVLVMVGVLVARSLPKPLSMSEGGVSA